MEMHKPMILVQLVFGQRQLHKLQRRYVCVFREDILYCVFGCSFVCTLFTCDCLLVCSLIVCFFKFHVFIVLPVLCPSELPIG